MKNPIEQFREAQNMTMKAFAKKIGSNTQTISNIERRGVKTPEDIIRKIGLAFDDVNEGKLLQGYLKWKKEVSHERD